jgi:hypothetical protein
MHARVASKKAREPSQPSFVVLDGKKKTLPYLGEAKNTYVSVVTPRINGRNRDGAVLAP